MPVTKDYLTNKAIIKEDTCMKFCDEMKPLYLETDASRLGLGAT